MAEREGYAPGDYSVRGQGFTSGRCAACQGWIEEGEPFVIRYSYTGTTGGIFHAAHAPSGDEWYSLDDEESDG